MLRSRNQALCSVKKGSVVLLKPLKESSIYYIDYSFPFLQSATSTVISSTKTSSVFTQSGDASKEHMQLNSVWDVRSQ